MVDLDDVLAAIDSFTAEAEGLTVSGGEPFDQPGPLAAILRHWRLRSTRSVVVFTGREFEDLSAWLREHPNLIDTIISGPFRADVPQTLAMRGSDNQRLHVLSDLGREMLQYDKQTDPADQRLDIMFDENGHAWMAGIPARGDIARLRQALAAAGHQIVTSADRKVMSQ